MAAELQIEQYLMKQASKHGFLCWKFKSPGTSGVPDRILLGYGMIFFVETKAPGKKARPLQKVMHRLIREHGSDVFIIDNKPDVDKLFRELMQKKEIREWTGNQNLKPP